MLHLSYTSIREDAVPAVRDWLSSLSSRKAELTELARAQTASHELAHLIRGEDGPVLVYAIEASDLDAARSAMRDEVLPVASEWKRMITDSSTGHPPYEVLFEHPIRD